MTKPHEPTSERREQDGQLPTPVNQPRRSTYGHPNQEDGIQSGNVSEQPGFAPGGHVERPVDEAAEGTPGSGQKPCPRCGGSGRVDASVCALCQGEGTVIAAIGGG